MGSSRPRGARYEVRVGPADVGARVVVRRAVPEGGLTDLLGHLERWSEGVLVVRTRSGEVAVPVADVVAAKRVPDAPARR
ncbi:MAG: hypothetical protein M3P46_06805 [Actinomycetota bacterium]|nr:hypothetical protein [Actinomycetota bacterium]